MECRSLSNRAFLEVDASSVQRDELADERQSNAKSIRLPMAALHLREQIEDLRLHFRRDTDAGIGDLDCHIRSDALHRE